MNLPETVDDPSLLQHEPLLTNIALLEASVDGSRSATKDVISRFIDAMQWDIRATRAIKKWAYLVFKDVLSDENSFEIMDGGLELCKVFLEYQSLLHQGLRDGCIDKARECQARISRKGIGGIKLNGRGANARHSTGGRGRGARSNSHGTQRSSRLHNISGPKKGRHQVETRTQHPEAGLARPTLTRASRPDLTESIGDTAMSSIIGCGSHSTLSGTANDTPSAAVRLSVLPPTAKQSERSTSKKEKKRKAKSQKPPVITPSDTSEDDEKLSKAHVVAVADSTSHLPKRIAPNPCSQPYDLLGSKNQVDKRNSAYKSKTNKQHREDGSIPGTKDRRGHGFLLNRRKRDEIEKVKNLTSQSALSSFDSGKLRKKKSVEGLQTRATKRLRRASKPVLDSEPGAGGESTCDLAEDFQNPAVQGPLDFGPLLTQDSIHAKSKARRKRTRIEFETEFAMSHERLSADPHEFLGPDVRTSRPLPKKACNERLILAADEDAAVRGVPCGAPSLSHVDQLLRDGASNALAMLQEGVVPDWTQDEGHDSDCDDPSGYDQDEANDVQVTTEISTVSTVTPKPPVPAPPRIWAQSRQEVCESFPYFRSYHGGVYSKDDIVKGYLLGAYAASRDIFHHGGKLIISHGGGKSECTLDSRKGPKRYQTDQDQEASDKSVRALLKTCKDRRPIVLLADDKYALFPYDLTSANYTYVVLGFYWISHAWAECQSSRDGSGRIVRWKVAFQWCEGQDEPWWTPQREVTDTTSDLPKPISDSRVCLTEDSSHPANPGGDPSIQCKNCQEQSPFIYKQGWTCLNPRCNVFWSINGEDPNQLDYREEFLSLLPQEFERLPNLLPVRVVETPGGVTTTYAFSKGWHCTQCGRLSCRYKWEHWECPNCQFTYAVKGRIRSPKEFWHQRPSKGFLHSQIGKDSGIFASRPESINLGAHNGFTNCLTFILPHARGKIHLILGTPLSNGDANDIFQLYQQQASTGELRLRRYPLRNHRARGLLLTNYFSHNSGEPYQYVGGSGHTVPLGEAPECVRQALALIKERARLALRTDIPFNEVLSAAYMERQKMSFHSDNEKGLGPIVASLSLGSTALMHFRLNVNMENPRSKNTYALSLVLRHGDVLVMEGEGVQQYYQHTVVPMNFRIAATARWIGST